MVARFFAGVANLLRSSEEKAKLLENAPATFYG